MYEKQLELPILCSLAMVKSLTNELIAVQYECRQQLLTNSYEVIAANDEKYKCDLLPSCRTKVMEQSPLISENSGYESIQIYR